jgi:hypothetical protein
VNDEDSIYTERAHLVALLASQYPPAIIVDDDEWPVIYISTPVGQLSWLIKRETNLHLFVGTKVLPKGTKLWDGHSTEEKYQRIRALTEHNLELNRSVLLEEFNNG